LKINEITAVSQESFPIIDDFLTLLFEKNVSISKQTLKEIISSDNSHLFFAIEKNKDIMGMITVGIYVSPSGKKAWIEDVVVGIKYRGRGIGKKLTEFAIEFAQQNRVELLMLTSSPRRISANKLYKGLNFERKQTNVYKMEFEFND
jgi:ribosomal protein S18 acetylase RimI-like enzyme